MLGGVQGGGPQFGELVRWLRDLQEENRNLAGQLGYLQAQVEQYKVLQAPAESRNVAAPHQSAQEGQQGASMAGVVSDDLERPQQAPRKAWWRFW